MSTGATDITAPPGCKSISMESDGAVFSATRSGTITVPDEYMPELNASNAVRNGILSAGRSYRLGTRQGRVCGAKCSPRIWQVWTNTCPTCGQPTVPE
jgi:hypothetical protein